jgi:hypothetical protein
MHARLRYPCLSVCNNSTPKPSPETRGRVMDPDLDWAIQDSLVQLDADDVDRADLERALRLSRQQEPVAAPTAPRPAPRAAQAPPQAAPVPPPALNPLDAEAELRRQFGIAPPPARAQAPGPAAPPPTTTRVAPHDAAAAAADFRARAAAQAEAVRRSALEQQLPHAPAGGASHQQPLSALERDRALRREQDEAAEVSRAADARREAEAVAAATAVRERKAALGVALAMALQRRGDPQQDAMYTQCVAAPLGTRAARQELSFDFHFIPTTPCAVLYAAVAVQLLQAALTSEASDGDALLQLAEAAAAVPMRLQLRHNIPGAYPLPNSGVTLQAADTGTRFEKLVVIIG